MEGKEPDPEKRRRMSGCPGLLVGLVQQWPRPEEQRRPANTKNQSEKGVVLQQNRATVHNRVSFDTQVGFLLFGARV